MKVSTVSEMRELDRTAVERYGIKEELLMENAGLAACTVVRQALGVEGKRFTVVCGLGNNGGDGFVVARKLLSEGAAVRVLILGDPEKYKGAARMNMEIASRLPLEVRRIESGEEAAAEFDQADAIVDAVFGTGLAREVEGRYREVIEQVNASSKTVLSLDIPSGINGDTGRIMGVAVKAEFTVTFGLPKIGNLLYPGYEHCGRLYVTHISFPPGLYEGENLKTEINLPPPLPPRDREAHKGRMGDVLFVAGASTYYGAPCFSALSLLKAGGGYSRLAAPASIVPVIAGKGAEIVFAPQKESASGALALENYPGLLGLAEEVDMVVLGPGISLDEEAQELARRLAGTIEKPLLLDGDGITAVCPDLDLVRRRKAPTVLTPHLGEMSRLTGRPVSEIDENKVEVLRNACRDLGAAVVLKGAHSLVGLPDGRVYINMSGNPGMATAGTGDVLTGTIPAMFGQGLSFEDAVRKGVFLHGMAGDLAARAKGEEGMTAQDVLDFLPAAVKADREGLTAEQREQYQGLSRV